MNINEDIIFQILLRLPVKKLVQFRSVCTAWYTLIKSIRFTYEHLAFQRAAGEDERIILKYFNHSVRKDVVSIYDDYESLSLFVASPEIQITDSYWADFIGEANGIFCLSNNNNNISLMNPVLREFIMIPAFHGHHRTHRVGIGFAFDVSTYDYKVLKVDRLGDDDGKPCPDKVGALYSLSSNSWRELGRISVLDSYDLNTQTSSVFVNGSIHWLATKSSLEDAIFAFNTTTELFQEIQAPKQLQEKDYGSPPVLFVLDKSFLTLVLFSKSEVSSDFFFTVWVMKEYGVADSWTKEYCIQTIPRIERPLCFWKKDKLLFVSNERELMCHDLPTGQLHKLQQYSHTSFDKFGLMVFNESLISIS